MENFPDSKTIEDLIDLRFGKRAFRHVQGNFQLNKQVSEYREQLTSLSLEEFEAHVKEQRDKEQKAAAAKADRDEKNRFFNKPDAAADFDHWSKAAHWSLDEAIALSLGKAPEKVYWERLKSLVQVSEFAFQYHRRRDLALRAVAWKQLFNHMSPATFLAWAKRTELDIPEGLAAAVASRGEQATDWQKLCEQATEALDKNHQQWMEINEKQNETITALKSKLEEVESADAANTDKSLSTRERDSLLKLVIGMALKGYAYEPDASRSGVPKEIASDLASCGLSLDEDTVRKYLKEAKELLPGSIDPAE